MSFTEKINVIIDVTTDKATKGIKDFKTAVHDAEGVTGKLKAGTKSLGDVFRTAAANPGVMAGGIAAAGAAAMAAVGKFAELGIEVGEFADATGLSTEESSRWIEVAGDLGVESDALKGTLGKLSKAIDPKLFKDLGIEIATTADGATDVNGTFLNVIDRLKAIKDPAEKARVAAKLLGKGWQEMAELIGAGSDKLSKSLSEVSDTKVLSRDEVDKARKYREAMDNLNDVIEDLAIMVGETLAPAIAEAAQELADLAGDTAPAAKGLLDASIAGNDLFGGLGKITGGIQTLKDTWHFFTDAEEPVKTLGETVVVFGDSNKETAQKVWELERATGSLKSRTQELDAAYQSVIAKLDNQDAWAELNRKLLAMKDGVGDTAQETRDYTRDLLEMIANLKDVPTEVKTSLVTKVNRGELDAVDAKLRQLSSNVIVIPVKVVGSGLSTLGAGGKTATGTASSPGGSTLVGEQGPEIVNMPKGANVQSAGETHQLLRNSPAGGGGVMNVYLQPRVMPTEREMIEFVNRIRRRNPGSI